MVYGDSDSESSDTEIIQKTEKRKQIVSILPRKRTAQESSVKEHVKIILVSPLSALVRDQVATFNSKGVSSTFVNSETESRANYEKVRQGGFHLVFISPECLLLNRMWRDMLLTDVYRML